MRVFGITLPGNTVERFMGSEIGALISEKLPSRIAAEGTSYKPRSVLRSRYPSKFERKKSLSLPLKTFGIQTGPPSVKPYWFHLNGSFFGRLLVKAYCLASRTSLRRNSNRDPWKLLVPDL